MCGCMRVCRMSSSLVLQLPQWHSRVSALVPDTTESLLSSFLLAVPARHCDCLMSLPPYDEFQEDEACQIRPDQQLYKMLSVGLCASLH